MYLLIVFLPLLGSSVAGFFGRFLGSEKIMMSGQNLAIMGILLFGTSLLFGLSRFWLRKKFGALVFCFVYLSLLFTLSLYFFVLRYNLLGIFFGLGGATLFSVSSREIISYPGPSSSPSSSQSWTEFDMNVLLESFSTEGTPVNQPEAGPVPPEHDLTIQKNISLESSMNHRIRGLENKNSIFLLDKEKGAYWNEIKIALDQAPTQVGYNRLLEFENRDLQIRELKDDCFSVFNGVLSQNPGLAEDAIYNPQEAIVDFFDEKRKALDMMLLETNNHFPVGEVDRLEMQFLRKVKVYLSQGSGNSIYNHILHGHPLL